MLENNFLVASGAFLNNIDLAISITSSFKLSQLMEIGRWAEECAEACMPSDHALQPMVITVDENTRSSTLKTLLGRGFNKIIIVCKSTFSSDLRNFLDLLRLSKSSEEQTIIYNSTMSIVPAKLSFCFIWYERLFTDIDLQIDLNYIPNNSGIIPIQLDERVLNSVFISPSIKAYMKRIVAKAIEMSEEESMNHVIEVTEVLSRHYSLILQRNYCIPSDIQEIMEFVLNSKDLSLNNILKHVPSCL
ncbi:hypothetical protein PCE1_002910 [Barthelona sp. PCE]